MSEFSAITHHITHGGFIFVFLDWYNCLNAILTSLSYTNTFYHECYCLYQVAKNMLQILMRLAEDFDCCNKNIDTMDDKIRQFVHNCGNAKCFHVYQSLSGGTRNVLSALETIEFQCVQIITCRVISCGDWRIYGIIQAMTEFFKLANRINSQLFKCIKYRLRQMKIINVVKQIYYGTYSLFIYII